MSFQTVGAKVVEGVAAGLYAAATRVMAESQQLVPVDTGTLKRSGRVEEPVYEGFGVSVTVGYGYGAAYEEKAAGDGDENVGPGYAIYVHENLESQHAPPTRAKFLEIPARAAEDYLDAVVAEAVRARLGGR